MNALLDTHTFLWFVGEDPQIPRRVRKVIEEPENRIYLSPASYWEIAIKINVGKYQLNAPYEQFWRTGIERTGIDILPIDLRHTHRLIDLPPHHRDPFDRLLIAQALADDLALLSGDATFDAYGVRRVW